MSQSTVRRMGRRRSVPIALAVIAVLLAVGYGVSVVIDGVVNCPERAARDVALIREEVLTIFPEGSVVTVREFSDCDSGDAAHVDILLRAQADPVGLILDSPEWAAMNQEEAFRLGFLRGAAMKRIPQGRLVAGLDPPRDGFGKGQQVLSVWINP